MQVYAAFGLYTGAGDDNASSGPEVDKGISHEHGMYENVYYSMACIHMNVIHVMCDHNLYILVQIRCSWVSVQYSYARLTYTQPHHTIPAPGACHKMRWCECWR
jgi:hypothetical protein